MIIWNESELKKKRYINFLNWKIDDFMFYLIVKNFTFRFDDLGQTYNYKECFDIEKYLVNLIFLFKNLWTQKNLKDL